MSRLVSPAVSLPCSTQLIRNFDFENERMNYKTFNWLHWVAKESKKILSDSCYFSFIFLLHHLFSLFFQSRRFGAIGASLFLLTFSWILARSASTDYLFCPFYVWFSIRQLVSWVHIAPWCTCSFEKHIQNLFSPLVISFFAKRWNYKLVI